MVARAQARTRRRCFLPACSTGSARRAFSGCSAHFDGGFVHFCGRHKYLFEALCRLPLVRAIDLGNSELYDTSW